MLVLSFQTHKAGTSARIRERWVAMTTTTRLEIWGSPETSRVGANSIWLPHRLIAENADSAATTYNVVIAADFKQQTGSPGYDVITDPAIYRFSAGECSVTV